VRTLWILIWLVVLALGNAGTIAVTESATASVPWTIGYDGRAHPTTAYDASSAPIIGYDTVRDTLRTKREMQRREAVLSLSDSANF